MASAATALKRKVYDNDSELSLVNRAKQGDQEAFTALYNQHFQRLNNVIHRMVNDDEADWLANIALTKAWEKLSQFRGDSKFSTWLTRFAINEALMYLRHLKTPIRARALPLSILEQNTKESSGGTTSRQARGGRLSKFLAIRDLNLAGLSDRQLLEQAIARVPEKYRVILLMRFWEGLSLPEIRAELKVTLPTVKSRLMRGRLMLVEQVEKIKNRQEEVCHK